MTKNELKIIFKKDNIQKSLKFWAQFWDSFDQPLSKLRASSPPSEKCDLYQNLIMKTREGSSQSMCTHWSRNLCAYYIPTYVHLFQKWSRSSGRTPGRRPSTPTLPRPARWRREVEEGTSWRVQYTRERSQTRALGQKRPNKLDSGWRGSGGCCFYAR